MEDRIRSLEERIEKLEKEVFELKALRNAASSIPKVEKPIRAPQERPVKHAVNMIMPTSEPKVPIYTHPLAQKPSKPKVDLEKVFVQVWLPRIFMVILLLGILWGLKMGMDNGWITNPVRILLGYLGTGLLGWFGYRQYRKKSIGLGLTMLGGMVATGMITTFAGHNLYALFGMWFAFILNLGFVAAGVYLANRLKSEALSVFSAFGAFLVPFLLEDTKSNAILFIIYILVLFLSLFYLSLRSGHKYAYYVIFFLFQLTILVYSLFNYFDGYELVVSGAILIQHFFVVGMYWREKVPQRIFSEIFLYVNFAVDMIWLKILDN